jgi:hypothetical protein
MTRTRPPLEAVAPAAAAAFASGPIIERIALDRIARRLLDSTYPALESRCIVEPERSLPSIPFHSRFKLHWLLDRTLDWDFMSFENSPRNLKLSRAVVERFLDSSSPQPRGTRSSLLRCRCFLTLRTCSGSNIESNTASVVNNWGNRIGWDWDSTEF